MNKKQAGYAIIGTLILATIMVSGMMFTLIGVAPKEKVVIASADTSNVISYMGFMDIMQQIGVIVVCFGVMSYIIWREIRNDKQES